MEKIFNVYTFSLFIIIIFTLLFIDLLYKSGDIGLNVKKDQIYYIIEGDINNPFETIETNYYKILAVSNKYIKYEITNFNYIGNMHISLFRQYNLIKK